MAQKKGGGSTRNGRDSESKRLGVKAYGGELIPAGSIIVRRSSYQSHLQDVCGTNIGGGGCATSLRSGSGTRRSYAKCGGRGICGWPSWPGVVPGQNRV